MDLVKTVKYGIGAIMVAGVIACGVGYAVNDIDGKVEHVNAETKSTAEYSESIDSQDTDNAVQHDVERDHNEPLPDQVNADIAEAHMYLNDYTGYNGLDGVTADDDSFWTPVRENLVYVADDITLNLDSVSDKDLRKDLANFVELVGILKTHEDKYALLEAHRIMHDLDININNYSGTTQQFNVTHLKGYGGEVDAYIKHNTK